MYVCISGIHMRTATSLRLSSEALRKHSRQRTSVEQKAQRKSFTLDLVHDSRITLLDQYNSVPGTQTHASSTWTIHACQTCSRCRNFTPQRQLDAGYRHKHWTSPLTASHCMRTSAIIT